MPGKKRSKARPRSGEKAATAKRLGDASALVAARIERIAALTHIKAREPRASEVASREADKEAVALRRRSQRALIDAIQETGTVKLRDLEQIQRSLRIDSEDLNSAFLDLLKSGQVVDSGAGYAVTDSESRRSRTTIN